MIIADPIFTITLGPGPIVAAAIHNGHAVRDELRPLFALSEKERLYEEDPFTADLTAIVPARVVGLTSRFEVDLNRPREKAVYQQPKDAWGLTVWKEALPEEQVARSLERYDAFYRAVQELLDEKQRQYGGFVVLDLHSYNHRRAGPDAPAADPDENPEVNVGTSTLDRERWGPLIERFMADLRAFDFGGRSLDVRENVKFKGGYFPRWINERYGNTGCALAIEFKKTFMNEWTGEVDQARLVLLKTALASTLPGLRAFVNRRA